MHSHMTKPDASDATLTTGIVPPTATTRRANTNKCCRIE